MGVDKSKLVDMLSSDTGIITLQVVEDQLNRAKALNSEIIANAKLIEDAKVPLKYFFLNLRSPFPCGKIINLRTEKKWKKNQRKKCAEMFTKLKISGVVKSGCYLY